MPFITIKEKDGTEITLNLNAISAIEISLEEKKDVVPPSVFKKEEKSIEEIEKENWPDWPIGTFEKNRKVISNHNMIVNHHISIIKNELREVRKFIGDDRAYPKERCRMLGQEDALVAVIGLLDKELK